MCTFGHCTHRLYRRRYEGQGCRKKVYLVNGKDFLARRIQPCFGRAITENDKGAKLDDSMKVWLYPEFRLEDIDTKGDVVKTDDGWNCNGECVLHATYQVAEGSRRNRHMGVDTA
jgi:hypothetical protein